MRNQNLELSDLEKYRSVIAKKLVEYFESDLAKESIRFTIHGRETYRLITEFSNRDSKRIRGSLTIATYKMFGGDPDDKVILEAAVAMELIQNYLLVIDDVMDRSVARRNGPTLHVQYLSKMSDETDSEEAKHLSNMLAINAGLILQHMALEIIAQLNTSADKIKRASALIHKNIITTGYGQIDDLYNNVTHDAKEKDILRLHMQKTSFYTFVNPTHLGAVLAGASGKELLALEEYGINAGIVFQLHDDIIGLFGSEKVSGKSSMDDLKEGKRTLLIERAYRKASSTDKMIIDDALGNANLSKKQHIAVQNLVRSSGSLEYSNKLKKKYALKAERIVEAQDWSSTGKAFLTNLIQHSMSRGR